ncbi:PREDICTED: podocan isoform X3 [Lipotes vexillifer]|uniref:Podocan isoform X3 n=1 Tax=Lipotes vexillifer TaxID=118797 RepID=A0A340YII7_LIPVE|nr:PREDICTED: podocan isoform X3 [Lipotes vexillifer]
MEGARASGAQPRLGGARSRGGARRGAGAQQVRSALAPGGSDLTLPAGTMARSGALLLLLLLRLQLQLGPGLAVRAPVFGRSGAHSLSPEENEFVEEEPVLVLSPEEPGRGPPTIDCPRDCACSQEGVVDCGGIDLREFPGDLPEHTNHLSLQNNKLEKIPPGAFSELSNLRELYLQNNYLTDEGLDNETFWKLSSLEYLDLSSNNLSRVPAGLPRSLVLLHLEKNAIRSVDADVLTPIRSLEYLLLHSNQLRAQGIHPRAFQGLKRLHTVHLYNNALERVPSGLPRRVRTLMILHNQITGIGRDDFATTYFLEELNLSYNRITSPQVHRDAFRKLRLLRSLDLSGNRLRTLPPGLPRNVHVLKIKRNELAALARGALAGMAQLRELYLTGNRLRSRALAPRAWADLAGLQLLDIAGNQLTDIPERLPESLEYLYLQNNKISTVPANAFDSTPNLKGIFLRFNKLAVGSVVESAFQRLKHLQVLDIEGNHEYGDVSKDRGRMEEEEQEEDEERW